MNMMIMQSRKSKAAVEKFAGRISPQIAPTGTISLINTSRKVHSSILMLTQYTCEVHDEHHLGEITRLEALVDDGDGDPAAGIVDVGTQEQREQQKPSGDGDQHAEARVDGELDGWMRST
jgi:hypothetical protein